MEHAKHKEAGGHSRKPLGLGCEIWRPIETPNFPHKIYGPPPPPPPRGDECGTLAASGTWRPSHANASDARGRGGGGANSVTWRQVLCAAKDCRGLPGAA